MNLTTLGNITLGEVFAGLTQLFAIPNSIPASSEPNPLPNLGVTNKLDVPSWMVPDSESKQEGIPKQSEPAKKQNEEITKKSAYQYGIALAESLPIFNAQNDSEYRSLNALNWSMLKRFLDDPRWFSLNPDQQYEETESMKLGTMIHCMILEKQEFKNRYAQFLPPVNEKTGEPYKSGKAYETAKAEFESQGKIACTEDQIVTCFEVKKSLIDSGLHKYFTRPDATKSQHIAMFEVPLFDPVLELKGKIDCYHESYGLIDFKTCSTPICDSFGKDLFQYRIKQFGYIYQLAFYAKIIRDKTGIVVPCSIIAAETSAPYRSGLYTLTNDTIEDAIRTIENNYLPKWNDYKNGELVTNSYSETI